MEAVELLVRLVFRLPTAQTLSRWYPYALCRWRRSIIMMDGQVVDSGCARLAGSQAMGAVSGLKLASDLRRMASGPEAFVGYGSSWPTTD